MVRRVLSILLCGCLLAGSLPVTGLAAEEQAAEATEVTAEYAGGGGIAKTYPYSKMRMPGHLT